MVKAIIHQYSERFYIWIMDKRRSAVKKRQQRRMNTELTGDMAQRRSDILQVAKKYCEILLESEPGNQTKQELNYETLGLFIYESAKFFRKHGFEVCVPRVYQKNYIRRRCSLKNCKCRECKYSRGK